MKRVEREFRIAELASDLPRERLRTEPSFLVEQDLGAEDAGQFRERLEETYIVRLFAVFETGLREAWSSALKQATEPPAEHLLNGIAARRTVPTDLTESVHQIRRFRNTIVHGGEAEAVSMADASGRLNRFFARLPPNW